MYIALTASDALQHLHVHSGAGAGLCDSFKERRMHVKVLKCGASCCQGYVYGHLVVIGQMLFGTCCNILYFVNY